MDMDGTRLLCLVVTPSICDCKHCTSEAGGSCPCSGRSQDWVESATGWNTISVLELFVLSSQLSFFYFPHSTSSTPSISYRPSVNSTPLLDQNMFHP